MAAWGPSLYGDPCRQCGFAWSIGFDDGVAIVAGLPDAYGGLVSGASGNERHPDLGWSVAEYVCHVADNLRIWAERLVGAVEGDPPEVGGYDENELADARHYESIPLRAATWSLARAAADWVDVVVHPGRTGTVIVHPDRGRLTLADVVRSNAHDAFHHQWDIQRTLQAVRS